jgi:hypothetical protein
MVRTDVGDFGISNVLPSSHPTVQMVVLSTHVKSHHVGVQGLCLFREKFWILRDWQSNRAFLSTCNVWRRHHCKPTSLTSSMSVGCCCVWNYGCWYGRSTLSGRWSQDVGYVCTPVWYIVWFTWNWPCYCPLIPLFKHFQNLFPDVESQWLSTPTLGPILRIPQRPCEKYCSEVSSVTAQWERYKRNFQVFRIYWRDNHSLFPIQNNS